MKKLSAPGGAILALAALFLAFGAGWTLGGRYGAPIRVETTRRAGEGDRQVILSPVPEPGGAEKVDINRATAEELTAVPGIGETLARDIVDERERGGPFRFPEDLIRVRGIGEENIEEILNYITAGEGT